ncbi:MAG: glycosyltransferase family 4 protein [Gemmatimonadales bacterium]
MGPSLLLAHDFPPVPGGIAQLLGAVAHHAGKGQMIVSTGLEPYSTMWDAGCASRIERVPVRTSRLKTPLGLARWSRAALRLARESGAGFCWAGNLKPAGYVAHWLHLRDRLPYGLIVYGLDVLQLEAQVRRSRPKRFAARAILGGASGTIAISQWTADRFRALAESLELPEVAARVEVVPLGTDPRRFRPDIDASAARKRFGLEGKPWLLTVSRLVPHKGIDTVISALPMLPEVRYAVGGVGPDRRRLEQLADQLGVRDRVRFLGSVPEAQLPGLYRAATLYAGLSREANGQVEGFGLSLVEAQASGIPVIASTSGGIPDAVMDGRTGVLIQPDDPTAAAVTMIGLLSDPGRRAAMGRSGRARVEQYLNWERVAGDLARLSEEWKGRNWRGRR